MELTLKANEAELLQAILREYLSDLRMEICGTDSYSMREDLKGNERIIKEIIDQLEKRALAV